MTEPNIEQPTNQLLPGLIQRPPELGRIRMGEKGDKGQPVRLRTFRLTSYSQSTLEAAASLYGGKVTKWDGAPDEGMWQLTTAAAELDILIPGQFGVISQSFELWKGGTCERRCDGTVEAITNSACICEAEAALAKPEDRQRLLGADRPCDTVTRLRVMLPRLPGLGVWRLDTGGFAAATTLPSTVLMLQRLTPGAWIPAVLRAEQRSKRERLESGKVEVHRFVVPVIDLPGVTISAALGTGSTAAPATAQLEAGKPPTAAERVAARRAELEQQAGAPAATVADQGHVGGNEAASLAPPSADASEPAPSACPVRSPRGAVCELPGGHDADHRRGNVKWPTPQRPDGTASQPGREATAKAAGDVPAPAADLTGAAAEIFEGEFVEAPSESLGLDQERKD